MLRRIVAPRFRLVSLPRAIAPPRCIDRRCRGDFQRLLYPPGRLTRLCIASRLHSTNEKVRPCCRTAELQLTRYKPARNLRMAEFDPGTMNIEQRANQF